MASRVNDPLLLSGKIVSLLLMGLTGLVTVILIGMVPVLLFNQGEFAKTVLEGGGSDPQTALIVAIATLILAAAVTAMAFHFFQLLKRMIETVGENDPLTLENADRLNRMGWIALLFQAASFPITAMGIYLGNAIPSENLSIDYEFTLTGVMLALVLFILARVFRHGAAMREDLEGTV